MIDVQEILKLEGMINGILIGEFLGLFIAWHVFENESYIIIITLGVMTLLGGLGTGVLILTAEGLIIITLGFLEYYLVKKEPESRRKKFRAFFYSLLATLGVYKVSTARNWWESGRSMPLWLLSALIGSLILTTAGYGLLFMIKSKMPRVESQKSSDVVYRSCPKCGVPVVFTDNFCWNCGLLIKE